MPHIASLPFFLLFENVPVGDDPQKQKNIVEATSCFANRIPPFAEKHRRRETLWKEAPKRARHDDKYNCPSS
jgi:hypothetical protein